MLDGMADHYEVAIVRWPDPRRGTEAGLAELLAAYHGQTEAEKGCPVTDVTELPDRYRAEILSPQSAFAGDVVLVAVSADTAVGCLVVTAPVDGHCELKRLWTDPAVRGRGVASALIRAALAESAANGVGSVRLSVWSWRTEAIALYQRLGFTVTESWDERADLVCLARAV